MLVVDTHCHASQSWFQPVETLLHEMSTAGVDKALLVQIGGEFDNTYNIECMRRFPGRFSVVGLVDHTKPDAGDKLAAWVKQGIEGVRLSPNDRSPGSDPLAIWRQAAELGIAVSLLGTLEQFADPAFEEVLKVFPRMPIIIEHLGGVGPYFGPGRADKTIALDTYKKALALAKYPNAYMKIPGLGEFTPRPRPMSNPPFTKIEPLIEMAIDAFGARRLMWGSDFPPSANREGYRNALRGPMEFVKFKSQDDKEWVFGKTAASLFKFGA